MHWNKCIQITHRWVSLVFTVAPLALQFFTVLYLFVLPYARWRSGQRSA